MTEEKKKRASYWDDPNARAIALAKRAANPAYASPERGNRIAAAAKARWADPEYNARMRAAMAAARAVAEPKGKSVTINGVTYPTLNSARLATGLSVFEVRAIHREQKKVTV
jgi:hypothetical protein